MRERERERVRVIQLGQPSHTPWGSYRIGVALANAIGGEAVAYDVQIQNLAHSLLVPNDIRQIGVHPGLVAGREQRHILQIVDGVHEHIARVHDRLVELVQRTVLLNSKRGLNSVRFFSSQVDCCRILITMTMIR